MSGLDSVLANLDSMAAIAAGALVSAAWQGAALAGLAWVGLRIFPRLSAGARSAVWLSVFALLVGLQAAPLAAGFGSDSQASAAAGAAIPPVIHLDPRWSIGLAVVWLAMTAFRLAQLAVGLLHLRRLAADAVEISVLNDATERKVTTARQIRICASAAVSRPCAIGFLRPRVLIPLALLENLSEAELGQVVAHEMEHLRRGDDWTNLAQKLAVAAFPLNPALGWVERQLCAERELACDDSVLAGGSGRKAYALCLTRLAEFALSARGFSLVLGAWEHRPELVRRVERILHSPARAMSRRAALGATAGVLACAVFGAVELSHAPQVVSFAPAASMSEVRAISAQIGGAPKLVKAGLAVSVSQVPESGPGTPGSLNLVLKGHGFSRAENAAKNDGALAPEVSLSHPSARNAEGWSAPHVAVAKAEPEIKLAGLRMGPPPENGKLMVLTGWSAENEARVVFATMRGDKVPAATAVQAVYIVATPSGWLIVRI